jgi:hypothetical protein
MEDITYSNDFLKDIEIKVSYLINIPEKGILEIKEVEKLRWHFFTDKLYKRWKWFFKYRAALLQIKYPKFDVEIKCYTSDVKSQKQEINLIERKISAKKRKVTEFFNKAERVKLDHNELFPIEDNPIYQYLKDIEIRKRKELEQLEFEYNSKINL